jgi:hypothetical protein
MPIKRYYYSDTFKNFRNTTSDEIIGRMVVSHEFSIKENQRDAWIEQIRILQGILLDMDGRIYFEFSIPRMGKRIDTVLIVGPVIFIIEFKVGEEEFQSYALDQVWDYALDLKNFHESSHNHYIAPILVATKADTPDSEISTTPHNDKLLFPIMSNEFTLGDVIRNVISFSDGPNIDIDLWEQGRYCPTPTIIEAAMALYGGHSVSEISRSDASAINLTTTSNIISQIIKSSKDNKYKSICFVTGVPGAGKTLVGLNIATKYQDRANDLHSVFLSGNGPLVDILREALARDKVQKEKECGHRMKKGEALSEVKMFIQNVHHFRDECLADISRPPVEHVALFDEAQRAWNKHKTADFMRRKKHVRDFNQSEPEFLISCLNRHVDWATIVCLVGGGQEINTGEAGISEWIESLNRSFPDWHIHISSKLTDDEYGAGQVLESIQTRQNVMMHDDLHLSVSMRSFRAENVSLLVKKILDLDTDGARVTLTTLSDRYPIVITRDINAAKRWLKEKARGTERYGIVVSSQAERLKPHAIDVKSPVNPIHWFLDGKEDVRSSYYLEDVVTEFHIQGLELDWVCVTWDADFRYRNGRWEHRSFRGNRWINIKNPDHKNYLKNAYRVLLTRARQGMVIVIPPGDSTDPTRQPEFYDSTFEYLRSIGFAVLQ